MRQGELLKQAFAETLANAEKEKRSRVDAPLRIADALERIAAALEKIASGKREV